MTKNLNFRTRLRSEAIVLVFSSPEKVSFKNFQKAFSLLWELKFKKKGYIFMHMYQLTPQIKPDLRPDFFYYQVLICSNKKFDLNKIQESFAPLEDQGIIVASATGLSTETAIALSITITAALPADLQYYQGLSSKEELAAKLLSILSVTSGVFNGTAENQSYKQ